MVMKLLIGLIFSAFTLSLIGQDRLVRVKADGFDSRKIERVAKRTFKEVDLEDLLDELRYLSNRSGYVLHSSLVDSTGDTIVITLQAGNRFVWNSITVNEETRSFFRKSGVNIDRLQKKSLSPIRLGTAFNKVLRYCENHGFPFATIKMDSVEIVGSSVTGAVDLDPGPITVIDSLQLLGNLNVRESFIGNYTGVKEGSDYNEQRIRQSVDELNQVPFIEVVQNPQVRFNKGETKVIMFLNEKKASRFDGIIGFLPDEQTGDLLITGDVSLHLENSLKQGEVIDLQWRRLQSNTQDLVASFSLPYVLNSPIGPDGRLKIYRRDTTFTDIFGQAGLRYIFRRNNYLRAFADRQVTNLISTAGYENTVVIPEFLDRSITSYGLGFRYSKYDYPLNPSKGVLVDVDGAVGTKRILENSALPDFIYDSLNLTSLQFRSNATLAYYLSIVPRLVWHQQLIGGSILNDQVFNNEATRIGGLKTLRGFNEEAIFATSYSILRNELRYQIERDGYVFLLFDGAWYENASLNHIGARRDTPYAFGAGITLGTRAGIFSLSAAAGSEQGNPILIRAVKFHFGFLSVF
ncbi:MAG: hypothetical protein Salg2KO_02440 [Salibacteraceae bacterium]